MAGITAMGDLSHELESLVLNIDSGTVRADDHAHAVMQASFDELARMRDVVSAGALPAAATALLAQIRGLAMGETRAEPSAAPAVAPPIAAGHAAASQPVAPITVTPHVVAPGAAATPHVVAPAAATPHVVAPGVATPAAAAVAAALTTVAPGADRREPGPAAPSTPGVSPKALSEVLPLTAAPPALGEDSISTLEISTAPVLPGRETVPAERVEMARVDADLLDTMLNNAGEVSIYRARLDQQVNSIDFNLRNWPARSFG